MSPAATRQFEILRIIARYGVMNTQVLSQLLSDRLSPAWVRAALIRLETKKLIARGTCLLGGRPSNYWMLSNESESFDRAIALTGLDKSQIRTKSAHWSSFPHENLCTIFQASVERQMPSVWLLRESTGNFSQLPSHLISERVKRNGYLPDMCLGIPTKFSNVPHAVDSYKWIAVEIDRTRRSAKRVAARANIYSRHTSFAGVLYLMPNSSLADSVCKIYNTRGASESLRIKGGSLSFLAASAVPQSLFDVNALKVSCGKTEIPLTTWLALFVVAETHKRDSELLRISNNTLYMNEKLAV